MKSEQIRKLFLKFFKKRGHKIVPSASLVPENDPSVLFTTAGMQQFKPYFTAPNEAIKDFGSLNTASIQKCVRTSDIESVGDESHLTFFEMLGNFSFGGYGKKEAIQYGYEFITNEMGLKIDYVSVFGGEDGIPADTESEKIWIGITPNIEIKKSGREDNFWGPTGLEGPCGPTSEIYVNGVEIWNLVFNEYYQNADKSLKRLETFGIDTGMGLERLAVAVQNKRNVFETDLFEPIISKIQSLSTNHKGSPCDREERIVADHIRTAVFMVSDGVVPSNTDRGYILRRIIRRGVKFGRQLGLDRNNLLSLIDATDNIYGAIYSSIRAERVLIKEEIRAEIDRFSETLERGLREFEKGRDPFILYSTYGFPIELTLELAREKGITVDMADFDEKIKKHQELSRTSSAGMFKGGLADLEPQTIKLHTAHHLLLSALQEVFGKDVKQRGSNITQERLRMDFSFGRKITPEEIKKVEEIVNERIRENLKVTRKEMPRVEAETLGAEMEFGAKYPEIVSVYFIENDKGEIISKEFCGGPHVEKTGELGNFKIIKEEAVSAGTRRIKAQLE